MQEWTQELTSSRKGFSRLAQEEGRVMPESDDMIVPKLSTEALLCLHTAAEEFVKGFMFDSNVSDAAGYPSLAFCIWEVWP